MKVIINKVELAERLGLPIGIDIEIVEDTKKNNIAREWLRCVDESSPAEGVYEALGIDKPKQPGRPVGSKNKRKKKV